MGYTVGDIAQVRKGIKKGEIRTWGQEQLLEWLGIKWQGREPGDIQQEINRKVFGLRSKKLL